MNIQIFDEETVIETKKSSILNNKKDQGAVNTMKSNSGVDLIYKEQQEAMK